MKKNIIISLCLLVLLILITVGAWALWYSYERHAAIAHGTACDESLRHPTMTTAPDGSLAELHQLCTVEVVPPTIWNLLHGRFVFEDLPPRFTVTIPASLADILLGRYSVQPTPLVPISGCDQSATTTDCATIGLQNPPKQPQGPGQSAATTTKTIGNFTVAYPSDWYMTGLSWEMEVVPGAYAISATPDSDTKGEQHVFVYTAAGPGSSINPDAQSLDDYRTDYPLSATSTRQVLVHGMPTTIETREEVRILSSENVTINGILMLRQRYSVGEWSLDSDGNRIFDSSSEADVTNELRYVFFDGTTSVIITGWQQVDDYWIDYIAHTVRLVP